MLPMGRPMDWATGYAQPPEAHSKVLWSPHLTLSWDSRIHRFWYMWWWWSWNQSPMEIKGWPYSIINHGLWLCSLLLSVEPCKRHKQLRSYCFMGGGVCPTNSPRKNKEGGNEVAHLLERWAQFGPLGPIWLQNGAWHSGGRHISGWWWGQGAGTGAPSINPALEQSMGWAHHWA